MKKCPIKYVANKNKPDMFYQVAVIKEVFKTLKTQQKEVFTVKQEEFITIMRALRHIDSRGGFRLKGQDMMKVKRILHNMRRIDGNRIKTTGQNPQGLGRPVQGGKGGDAVDCY